jgi:hypothetical protein
VNIVGDCESITICSSGIKTFLEIILGNLDLFRCKLVIVISIEVERGHNIAQSRHVGLTSSRFARGVWWAHISRVFADDVADGHFVLDHLVDTLLVGDLIEVLVGPSVTGNLVAVGMHL